MIVDESSRARELRPGVEARTVRRVGHPRGDIELPVATIRGRESGPTFVVMSGMHAGEYAGVLAAQKLIQCVRPAELKGRLIVVPVISTRAFMMRSMQLSPVDEQEAHFQTPGNPEGSYTESLVDLLFGIVKDADYLIDMHSGEFAQALMPWVPVPQVGSEAVQARSMTLALGFRVRYIEPRRDRASIPPFAACLAEAGVANIWSEVGKNGLPAAGDIAIQYDGVVNALRSVGMLPGVPERPTHEYLSGEGTQITADVSGVWRPAVREGDIVEEGQFLGEITDYFGEPVRSYASPFRGVVLYYWTSPAINHERRPHGYDWHSGLVRLARL